MTSGVSNWGKTWARLIALRQHLPEDYEIHERLVREYHSLVDEMEHLGSLDLANFRVVPDDIHPKVVAARRPSFRGPGKVYYSEDKYCLRTALLTKLDGLINFFEGTKGPHVVETEPLLPSEKTDLAIYRYVETVGVAQWRPMSIGELANATGFKHELLLERLISLQDKKHIDLRKWSDEANRHLPLEEAGIDRFFRGFFEAKVTPSGRPYFERLQRRESSQRNEDGSARVFASTPVTNNGTEERRYSSEMRAKLYHILRARWGDLESHTGYGDWHGSEPWQQFGEDLKFATGKFELPFAHDPQEQIKMFLEGCSDQDFESAIRGMPRAMGDEKQDLTETAMNQILKELGIPLIFVGDQLVKTDPKDFIRDKFGLPDHRAFKAALREAAKGCKVVSVLFLDLDNFKKVNDTYNHEVGDGVIREMAAAISKVLERKGELYHRSGDEMLVLLRNFDIDEASGVAERIRKAVEFKEFGVIGRGVVTTTIAISAYPEPCSELERLEVTADQAAMKQKGIARNKILRYDPTWGN